MKKVNKEQSSPPIPFDNERTIDMVDDEDDCIICGKLLLNHTEEKANECYSTLTKKQIFRKELAKKKLEVH